MSSKYKKINLTPDEEKFVKVNYETMPVTTMAQKMSRAASTLYSYMERENLKPFRAERATKDRNHPFRKANRRLESFAIQRRIENRKANGK